MLRCTSHAMLILSHQLLHLSCHVHSFTPIIAATVKEAAGETVYGEDSWNMQGGVFTSDEFVDVNSTHKTVTLTK